MIEDMVGKTIIRIEMVEAEDGYECGRGYMVLYFSDKTYGLFTAADPNCKSDFYATIELVRDGQVYQDEMPDQSSYRCYGEEVDIKEYMGRNI